MKTDKLIAVLAADATPAPQVGGQVARWFLPALALAGLIALSVVGVRSDILAALAVPVTGLKPILPALVALAAGFAVLRLARPGGVAGWLVWPITLIAALVAIWLTATLASLPAQQWWPAVKGQSLAFCLTAIPVIALLPLAALIAALRSGASTRPVLTGAMAGLAAGAGATAIYAMHCTEDNPLFFLCWYAVAILIVTAIGALAGRRWLRW